VRIRDTLQLSIDYTSDRPEKLKESLNERQVVYAGIDPTARSLHVGHLLPMLCLLHFQIRGHQIIPMVCLITTREFEAVKLFIR
jgi:tyrosyl-tRNA synthetase